MSASWSTVEALRSDSVFLADVETTFREEDEQRAERKAIRWADQGSASSALSSLIHTRRITSYSPAGNSGLPRAQIPSLVDLNDASFLPAIAPYSPAKDSVAVGVYLDARRKDRLKKKHGWGAGIPKVSRESCVDRTDGERRLEFKDIPVEHHAAAEALRAIGLPKRADRREVCGLVYELSECECEEKKTWKSPWVCKLRSHPPCALKIFNRAFSRLVPLEDYIPASFQSLPGWGWKILDNTFHHDGEFAPPGVLQKMRQVVNRTRERVWKEECSEIYNAGYYSKRVQRKGKSCYVRTLCPVRFTEKDGERWPMRSRTGWPLVSAPDGSVRELVGWDVVWVGKKQKRPTCLKLREQCGVSVECGCRVKKIKPKNIRVGPCEWMVEGKTGGSTRSCPKCGPVEWPDWENREIDAGRWRLRFGVLHIPTSEFGFENNNYHFHSSFFGPILPNKPTCSKCKSFLRRRCSTCGWLVKENKTPTRGWDCANCGHVDRNDEGKLDWDCANCGHVNRNIEGELDWDCLDSEAVPKLVDGRLTQIFKEESKNLLGVESRGVWIQKAKSYRAALAHALKYVAKPPASTPEGLAAYEKALVGVRRYAVCGFLQGVEIVEEKRDPPRCQHCGKAIRKIPGLGPVPFFEVEDIPLLHDEPEAQNQPPREPGEDSFDGPVKTFAHAPRAPC